MAGYFSPTQQKNELAEKEIMCKLENAKEKIENYTLWYSEKINCFKKEIEDLGFRGSFGYEIIKRNDTTTDGKKFDDFSFFDIAPICGVAFDNHSRRLIYYFTNPGIYENYANNKNVNVVEYRVLSYHEIKKAVCNVDSSTISETTASKSGVITRSIIGGLIAGETGAIIGGLSGGETSQTSMSTTHNSCEIIIYTNNEECPVIRLFVEKLSNSQPDSKNSREMVVDLTEGVLGNKRKANYFNVATNQRKEYGASSGMYIPSKMGEVYELVCKRNIYAEDMEEYQNEIRTLNKSFDAELQKKYFKRIRDSVNIYETKKNFQEMVEKIEANVLTVNGDANQMVTLTLIEQLERLVKIKLDGFITEEEFVLFKKKLLEC